MDDPSKNDWKFNPPRAPNFVGLCESAIKTFNNHLKRVDGKPNLTYEDFLTLTIQIEGISNSRPLVALSSNIEDLYVLTAGYSLVGRPINSLLELNLTKIIESKLTSCNKIKEMTEIVWKMLSNDYFKEQIPSLVETK